MWRSFQRSGLGLGTWLFFGFLGVLWFVTLCLACFTRRWEECFITAFFTALAMHLIMKFVFALEATRQVHEDARGGEMELLLATPLAERNIVEGQAQAYQRRFGVAVFLLIVVNLMMELACMVFYKHLHMDHGVFAIFSMFFLGGIVVLLFDFRAIQWVGLWRALRSRTHLRATFATLASVELLPWIVGPILFTVAMSGRSEEKTLVVLGIAWFGMGVILDLVLISFTESDVRHRFRQMVATRGGE